MQLLLRTPSHLKKIPWGQDLVGSVQCNHISTWDSFCYRVGTEKIFTEWMNGFLGLKLWLYCYNEDWHWTQPATALFLMVYSWLGHTVAFGLNGPTFSVLQKCKTQTHTHTLLLLFLFLWRPWLIHLWILRDSVCWFCVCWFSLTYNTVTSCSCSLCCWTIGVSMIGIQFEHYQSHYWEPQGFQ